MYELNYIKELVCSKWGVNPADISREYGKKTPYKVAEARQVICYLALKYYAAANAELKALCGYSSRGNSGAGIAKNVEKVRDMMQIYKDYHEKVRTLEDEILKQMLPTNIITLYAEEKKKEMFADLQALLEKRNMSIRRDATPQPPQLF